MRILSITLFILLVGCAATKESSDLIPPQPLLQQPLPPLPESLVASPFKLNIGIHVLQDGSVDKVIMRKGSGIALWDSAAATVIKQWRFLPARIEDRPISTWYHIHTTLRSAMPIYMTLAEIQCATLAQVDSVYEQLLSGRKLSQLVTPCCIDTVRGEFTGISRVNIYQYPERIRKILSKLDVNEFTRPIPYGYRFVIFQRL